MAKIHIEVVYALPHEYFLKKMQVEEGTIIQNALVLSGVLQQYKDIDLRQNKIGVFSRSANLTDILHEGDRIEIYRPLINDPKEIRRMRAIQQQEAQKKSKQ